MMINHFRIKLFKLFLFIQNVLRADFAANLKMNYKNYKCHTAIRETLYII